MQARIAYRRDRRRAALFEQLQHGFEFVVEEDDDLARAQTLDLGAKGLA